MKTQRSHPAHFSLELFPPRTEAGRQRLPGTVAALAALRPAYFSVTFGAGGSTQQGTWQTVQTVREVGGCAAAPHISCIGSTRARIDALLASYLEAGIDRLVVLRGDLPATAHGIDGDRFRIEVAAYPEMHPQARNPTADFERFVDKVRAGADAAITQYFYNAQAYFDFIDRCEAAGLDIPVVPGVMPITHAEQLIRFSNACGAEIPRWIRLRLEQYRDDPASLADFGVDVVAGLCRQLLDAGAPGLHFYTLNKVEPTLRLWKQIGLPVPPNDQRGAGDSE